MAFNLRKLTVPAALVAVTFGAAACAQQSDADMAAAANAQASAEQAAQAAQEARAAAQQAAAAAERMERMSASDMRK